MCQEFEINEKEYVFRTKLLKEIKHFLGNVLVTFCTQLHIVYEKNEF